MNARKIGPAAVLFIAVVVLAMPGWSQNEPTVTETSTGAVRIEDAVICRDVVDRQPVGSADVLPKESEKLYCFTRVVGAVGQTRIVHNWYHQGTLTSSVTLPVRSPNWRTWSVKAKEEPWAGEWMVEVLSEEGTPLESIIFFVQ
jgi:hypothetical protein